MYLPGPCRQHGACYGAYLPELGSADHSKGTLNGFGPHLVVQVSPDESCLSYLYPRPGGFCSDEDLLVRTPRIAKPSPNPEC